MQIWSYFKTSHHLHVRRSQHRVCKKQNRGSKHTQKKNQINKRKIKPSKLCINGALRTIKITSPQNVNIAASIRNLNPNTLCILHVYDVYDSCWPHTCIHQLFGLFFIFMKLSFFFHISRMRFYFTKSFLLLFLFFYF